MAIRKSDVEAVVEMAHEAPKKAFEHTVSGLKDGMAGAVAGFEKTQAEVQANVEKAMKTAEEFVSFGQANVEAMVKATQIFAAGMQGLGKTLASTMQAQIEASVATAKALGGVKSLKDAIELHSGFAKTSLETAMAETGKIADASVKLAEEAWAPINARVTLAVEKFGRAA